MSGAQKYKIVSSYIIEKIGRYITFSDGLSAVIDNSDANHIAHDAAYKKTAEISAIEKLIGSAVLYAYDDHVLHNKFNSFKFYVAIAELNGEVFPVVFNIGRARNDGKYHLYDLTNKIRDTARRINGVGRLREFLPENGIPIDSISESGNDVKQRFSVEDDAAEGYYGEIRSYVQQGRIYVPESVRNRRS